MANFIGLKDFEARSSQEYKLVMYHIQHHMEGVLCDDLLHAAVIGGGKQNYLNTFLREFHSMKGADRDMAEMLWALFLDQWRTRHGRLHPKAFLDRVEQVTPPTEKEIDEAWEVESASSDEGRRYFEES